MIRWTEYKAAFLKSSHSFLYAASASYSSASSALEWRCLVNPYWKRNCYSSDSSNVLSLTMMFDRYAASAVQSL